MALDDFLDQFCHVRVENRDQDEPGGDVREPHRYIVSNVPCSVREMGGGRDSRNDRSAETKQLRVYLDDTAFLAIPGLRLTTSHQLEIVDPLGDAPPRVLTIDSASNMQSRGELYHVDCSETPVPPVAP